MSENKLQAEGAKTFSTALTKVNDSFMPLIIDQLQKNRIEMTAYSKECVLHAISAINSMLDKNGVSWTDSQLDKSTVSDILVKIACFQLNAAASPREVYFQLRNEKTKAIDPETRKTVEVWKKKIEMGIEGDGNDSILSRFGRGVQRVCQIWKVRENDGFEYPKFNGLEMTPPQWSPAGSGKIVRIVYPIIMEGHDGNSYAEFYIAERADVIGNLVAHINSNLMNETFGLAENKFKASAEQKQKIDAKKRELLAKAKSLGLDAALDDPELQPWISPAWTEPHSRESMIERKMRNNAIKKIPKDFGNGAMETMFEEATDEAYRAAAREVKQLANGDPIDITVDEETGEVQDMPSVPPEDEFEDEINPEDLQPKEKPQVPKKAPF